MSAPNAIMSTLPLYAGPPQPADLLLVDVAQSGGTYLTSRVTYETLLAGVNANLTGITGAQLAAGAATTNLGYIPLNPANNLSDLATPATARTNLGLMTLATVAPGAGVAAAIAQALNNLSSSSSLIAADEGAIPNGIYPGTSLYPSISTTVSTTATSTSGSPTISVASSAGLSVGQIVDQGGTFGFPAGSVIQSISGTTLVVSQNATKTNSSPTAIIFGANRWDADSAWLANTIGGATGYFGSAALGNLPAWIYEVDPGVSYGISSAIVAATKAGGGFRAGSFYGLMSDVVGGGSTSLETIVNMCVVDVGSTQTPYGSWCHYEQASLTATTPGYHISKESDLWSAWTPVSVDPYNFNPLGHTTLERLCAGDGQEANAQNISSYLELINNGAAAIAGIVVGNGSLDTSSGFAPALAMPQAVGLQWFSAAATSIGQIYANLSGGFPYMNMEVASNGAFQFLVNGVAKLGLNATVMYPTSDGLLDIGASSLGFGTVYAHGYECRSGQSGAFDTGHVFNFHWDGTSVNAHLYIDGSDMGISLTSTGPASATTPGNFSATTRIPVTINGTTYYIAADTAAW